MCEWLKNLFGRNKKSLLDSQIQSISTEDSTMKYLIVGLGNMGSQYNNTRHNIGFDIVDSLAIKHDAMWKVDTLGDIAIFKHKGRTITLLKPSTFMNRSGKAVNHWMNKLKIKRDNILVLVDDLHLDFGRLRLRGKGSDGGHNGLKDIQETLGGNKYPRLKFGIGRDFYSGQQVDYVLGHWTSEQSDALPDYIEKATEAVLSFTSIGLKFTMEKYNRN